MLTLPWNKNLHCKYGTTSPDEPYARTKTQIQGRSKKKALALNVFFQSQTLQQPSLEQPSTPSTGISSSPADIETMPTPASCVTQPFSSSSSDSPRGLKKYLLNDQVAKAELLWCTQTVMTHKSMSTAGKDVKIIKLMFPEHDVISKLELQRQ